MFGMDWNLDGKIDLTEDYLTLALLNDDQEESIIEENTEGEQKENEQ